MESPQCCSELKVKTSVNSDSSGPAPLLRWSKKSAKWFIFHFYLVVVKEKNKNISLRFAVPKEKENLRHECNCDFAFLPRRIRACRNCDCRLVLCTAVSFILLLEYMTVNVCERLFCVGVSQKEISCLFFFFFSFSPLLPLCQWLWHSGSRRHLFYYPKLLNKHIIVPVCLSACQCARVAKCQTDDTQRRETDSQPPARSELWRYFQIIQ